MVTYLPIRNITMRVLHVFNEIKFSGAEIMYAAAAPTFKKEGVEMYALSTASNIGEYAPNFREKGIEVIHRNMPGSTSILESVRYFFEIKKILTEYKIDLIHIHRANAKFLFGLISFVLKLKCIYTVHNTFKCKKITWVKHYLVRYVLQNWFKVTFQSIGQSVYENELNYFKTKTIRINNWYDSMKFYQGTEMEKSSIRKKLNIPLESFVIISTGGCTKIKNHEDIIRAIAGIKNNKDIVYLHLGIGQETECEKQLAQEMNIGKNIVFLGNQENVREYLVASDVYIMSSHFEGLSIATLEAMACGIPCILYDVPGLRDLIVNESTGFLIKPHFEEIKNKIEYCMSNPLIAKSIALSGMREAKEEYLLEKNSHKIVLLYNQ